MDQADIPALLARLASDEDASRKMAVFKLQSSINDPAFADVFISTGGLVILRRLIMTATGNTLAYSLQSLTRLLEVDMGWDILEGPAASELVEHIVKLVVTNPLVNILRGAMSILVAIVSHSQSSSGATGLSVRAAPAESPRTVGAGSDGEGVEPHSAVREPRSFGFRALKPAIAVHPAFFELVIAQLHSADHALCANALALINALIRDVLSSDISSGPTTLPSGARMNGYPEEWSKFIKKLQDLGLIKAVYNLMQSSALQDLAHPLLEFQSLTKVLLRKWRDVHVDLERPEHRRALKGLHLASAPDRHYGGGTTTNGLKKEESALATESGRKGSRRHNPEKWRRLGFETESPAIEFEHMGFLGMMDMTDFVRKNEDGYQKLLLEQSTQPTQSRCPVAKSSLAVTMILYEHFEVDKPEEAVKQYQLPDGTKNGDKVFRPLLLQWSRLHTAGLHAFLRIWKATGAEQDDFDKVGELVRILVDEVVGQAVRTKDVADVEEELQEFDCARLREVQMQLLELSFEERWGHHLYQVREELKRESLQFVKEQRIRCLLRGSWFSKPMPKRDRTDSSAGGAGSGGGKRRLYQPRPWRFAKLSHNRRFLHYADFVQQTPQDPGLEAMTEKIDVGTISSVMSKVSAPETGGDSRMEEDEVQQQSTATTHTPKTMTKITIFWSADANEVANPGSGGQDAREQSILTLHSDSHSLASEWLDGLLMLLYQAPITAETTRLVHQVSDFGLKIRLLNVTFEGAYAGNPGGGGHGAIPSREGLDEAYYYHV